MSTVWPDITRSAPWGHEAREKGPATPATAHTTTGQRQTETCPATQTVETCTAETSHPNTTQRQQATQTKERQDHDQQDHGRSPSPSLAGSFDIFQYHDQLRNQDQQCNQDADRNQDHKDDHNQGQDSDQGRDLGDLGDSDQGHDKDGEVTDQDNQDKDKEDGELTDKGNGDGQYQLNFSQGGRQPAAGLQGLPALHSTARGRARPLVPTPSIPAILWKTSKLIYYNDILL